MSEAKLGTEKIEQIADALKKVVIAGKKISADKKIDMNDLPHALALIPELPAIVAAISEIESAWAEAKDIDVAEAVALIQAIHGKVKEVEKA
jgi:hypothetical protein